MIRTTFAAAIGLCAATLAATPGEARAGACRPAFTRALDAIPVYDITGTAPRPWNGGWEQPRPQLLDYDGDGDLDLFAAEDAGKLRYYRNDGTPSAPDFRFVTDEFGGGVHRLFFTRMVDIDGDDDWDLLVQAPPFLVNDGGNQSEHTGAFLYVNTGSVASPVWENLSTHPDGYFADAGGEPIRFDLTAPDFVDLDGDGDPDLMLGDQSGRIILYRNTGTPAAPQFTFETNAYGDILITPGNCAPTSPPRLPDGRHGFMLFTFHDLDRDARPDLFVGDQYNSNVYHYRNFGGGTSPILACQSEQFFPDSTGRPADFNEQRFVTATGDLDDDGDLDLLLGSATESFRSFRSFRNDGTPTVPLVRYAENDYLPEYDGGLYSAPALGDVDGDGDPDPFLGIGSLPRVTRFQNDGTPTSPLLVELDREWMPMPGLSRILPELADLDGDGDKDLFVGTNRGDVRWFRNDGAGPTANEIVDDAFGVNKLFRQHVDADAVPRFLDDDGDGDLDLVVGWYHYQFAPTLRYFRNDGTSSSPSLSFASGDYQGLGLLGQGLAPAFGDADGDGDADLVVGNFDGELLFFRNISTAAFPRFRAEGPLGIDVGSNAIPYLADLDGDGGVDLVVGERGGGLNHFRNDPGPGNPSAFALTDPPADAEVDGDAAVLFDWEPSIDPATGIEVASYVLRLAPSPDTPPDGWVEIGPLSASEANVAVNVEGLSAFPSFHWTVAAGEECRSAPLPEWRRAVNTAWSDPSVPPGPGPPPAAFSLPRAYPVPSDGAVTVDVAMPADGWLRVVVHDAIGRRVDVVYDAGMTAGTHPVTWSGLTRAGRPAAPGVYLIRAESGGRVATQRVVRVR